MPQCIDDSNIYYEKLLIQFFIHNKYQINLLKQMINNKIILIYNSLWSTNQSSCGCRYVSLSISTKFTPGP